MFRQSNLYITAMMYLTHVNCVAPFVYSAVNLANSVKNIYPRSGLAIFDVMLFGCIMYNYKYNAKDEHKSWKILVNIPSMTLCGLALVFIYMNIFPEIVFILLQTIHIVNVLIFDIDNKNERIVFIVGSLLSVGLPHAIHTLLPSVSASILIIISVIIMFSISGLLIKKTNINRALIARICIMHIILFNSYFRIDEIKGLILIIGCCADVMLCFWALHVKVTMLEINAYQAKETKVIWEKLSKGLQILVFLPLMVIISILHMHFIIIIFGLLMKTTVPTVGELLTLIEVGIVPITIGIVLGMALGVILGAINRYKLKRLKAAVEKEARSELHISLLIWVLVVIMLIIKLGLTMLLSITIGIALGTLTLAAIIDVESAKT